jgi:hypothetical protein
MFQPIAVTLITVETDAVLVDPPTTTAQTEAVGKWVQDSRKRLGAIVKWMAALDTVASLKPTHVAAGHKNKNLDDDPKTIQETRRYLVQVERIIASSHNAREFYDAMIRLYPDRKNRSALWCWGAKEPFRP